MAVAGCVYRGFCRGFWRLLDRTAGLGMLLAGAPAGVDCTQPFQRLIDLPMPSSNPNARVRIGEAFAIGRTTLAASPPIPVLYLL